MVLWCLLLFQHGHGVVWLSSSHPTLARAQGMYGAAVPRMKTDKTSYGLKLGFCYAGYLQAYVKKPRMY